MNKHTKTRTICSMFTVRSTTDTAPITIRKTNDPELVCIELEDHSMQFYRVESILDALANLGILPVQGGADNA